LFAAERAAVQKQEPAENPKAVLDAHLNPEPDGAEKDEDLSGQQQIVVVKRGDSLSRIIIRTYGSYNRATLSTVLRENPEIWNPDLILVEQVIKLPECK
jgi:nucleoid-associated protein YgaU